MVRVQRAVMKSVVVLLALVGAARCDVDSFLYVEEMWSAYPSGQFIEWPDLETKYNYILSGQYNPINILPTRFQMWNEDVYIVTPRYRCGVPSSVNKFQLMGSNCLVRLEPWPCLKFNCVDDPDSILNAIDLALDEDGILWLLDIGEIDTLGPPPYNFNPQKLPPKAKTVQPVEEPPRILGFHICNGSLEYKFELSGLIANQSRLQYIQVEKVENSDKKFIYVTDAGTRSILMYEVHTNRGYRILLPACLEEGEISKDILYMALVKKSDCHPSSLLFLTYLSSRRMFALPTINVMKKRSCGELMLVGAKPGPMVILGADYDRRIFFRMRGEGDVFMWQVDDEFNTCNFHLIRSSCCRRATHVAPGAKSMVWLLESNFHDFVRGTTGCTGPSTKLLPLLNQCEVPDDLDFNEAKIN